MVTDVPRVPKSWTQGKHPWVIHDCSLLREPLNEQRSNQLNGSSHTPLNEISRTRFLLARRVL